MKYPNQASFHLMKLEMDSFQLFSESICYFLMLKGIIWALLHFYSIKIYGLLSQKKKKYIYIYIWFKLKTNITH